MPRACKIKFENSISTGAVFWCGQTLRCNVILNFDKPQMVKGIFVTISGWAHCKWKIKEVHGETTVITYYEGNEKYIKSVTYLVGNANGDTVELPAGIYTNSFIYDIPPSLPSSIEGNEGHIRYNLKVTINRPFPHFDDNFKENLTFVKPFDLNSEFSLYAAPFQKDLEQTFWCFPCRSAPFSVVASIPQTGYAPGDIIKVNIVANNASNVAIRSIKSSLDQNINYFSESPYGKRVQCKKLTKSLVAGVPIKQSRNYQLTITVPPVMPTDQLSSKVIHVTYFIKICFKTNWHTSPCLFIPITIGTVRIGSSNTTAVYNF